MWGLGFVCLPGKYLSEKSMHTQSFAEATPTFSVWAVFSATAKLTSHVPPEMGEAGAWRLLGTQLVSHFALSHVFTVSACKG